MSARPATGRPGRVPVDVPVVTDDAAAGPPRAAPYREVPVARWSGGAPAEGLRRVPEEVPVAVRVDCADYAVMLASPTDLEDFGVGFLYTEGVIDGPGDIAALSHSEHDEGIVLRVERCAGATPIAEVREGGRRIAGATGCGLCGVEALSDAVRPVRRVPAAAAVDAAAVHRAVAGLREWQPLNASTGALHAAAFAAADGTIVIAREDVGRHNALDKLAGALLRDGIDPGDGFVVMTSRCSYELVQKAARLGTGTLCTVSAPTGLAIRLAGEAGMTLIAQARGDGFSVLTGRVADAAAGGR